MCPSRDQHIDVHLPRKCGEHLPVAGRHNLLPMSNTYPERLMRDRERERVVRVLLLANISFLLAAECCRHNHRDN